MTKLPTVALTRLPSTSSDPERIAWWLAILCAALPLSAVQSRYVLGGFFHEGFGSWRWVYLGLVFVAVTAALRAIASKAWLRYVGVLAAVGYASSALAYAVCAWGAIVSRHPDATPRLNLSQWLFGTLLGPWHILFVAAAAIAAGLVLGVRKLQ